MILLSFFACASADRLVLTKTKHCSGKLSTAIPSTPSIAILSFFLSSHSIFFSRDIPLRKGTGLKSLSTSSAFNQLAISFEFDTVADSPIICIEGFISLNFDKVTSSVGPLPESLIRCISSDTKHSTSDNQEGLCLISESALSEVDIIISYFDSPLALS